ncbi:helix-turn-helix domain-containing protein [Streptomyces umbrinus]|uniref:helix-turn-helix domain-containing protein n=1 Tax=Streptomyces umbrinus TaxID=67370 RepID=UPI003C30D508
MLPEPLPSWVPNRRRAIGGQIRAERKRQKLTQERLGELAGLDRKTINRVERARHATSIDYLLLIADALKVPLAHLVR